MEIPTVAAGGQWAAGSSCAIAGAGLIPGAGHSEGSLETHFGILHV